MRFGGLLVGLVLAVAIAGAALALHAREGNPQFVSSQRALAPVAPAALDALVLTTSDPRPGYAGRARGAHCAPGSASVLGNPWSCMVRYPGPPDLRYRVIVYGDRSIFGLGQPVAGRRYEGQLIVRGCCVAPS